PIPTPAGAVVAAPRAPAMTRAAALRVTAVQARHAAVEQHGGSGVALRAELRPFGEAVLRERDFLAFTRLELCALLGEHLLLLGREVELLQEPDLDQVPFDDVAHL